MLQIAFITMWWIKCSTTVTFFNFYKFPIWAPTPKSRTTCRSEMHQLMHQFSHVCLGSLGLSVAFGDFRWSLPNHNPHGRICASRGLFLRLSLCLSARGGADSPATSPGGNSPTRSGLGSGRHSAASSRRCDSSKHLRISSSSSDRIALSIQSGRSTIVWLHHSSLAGCTARDAFIGVSALL